MADHVHMI